MFARDVLLRLSALLALVAVILLGVGFVNAVGHCPSGCEGRVFGCDIKGNLSPTGEKIYHVSSTLWYERVIVNPARGERYFCTEAEAQQNGYRKALAP